MMLTRHIHSHFAIKDPNGVYVDVVQATESTEEYKSGYETK